MKSRRVEGEGTEHEIVRIRGGGIVGAEGVRRRQGDKCRNATRSVPSQRRLHGDAEGGERRRYRHL